MTKTTEQMVAEYRSAAQALPFETKRIFWRAMTKDGKNVGEAREIAGIDDVMVAGQLVMLLHNIVHVPMSVDEITD